jgi:hypothetical protein
MATAPGRDQGKTKFLKEFLAGTRDANEDAVNQAWNAAGNEGTISSSLISKTRSQLGLTGQGRSGSQVKESAGSADQSAAAPETRRRGTEPKKAEGRTPAKTNGRQVPVVTESEAGPQGVGSQAGGDDRTRTLIRLEGEIDDMIHEVKVAGGLPEFEETLRKARRILARSHVE